MLSYLKSKPLQIVYAVLGGFFLSPLMSVEIASFFFTLSKFLKEFLMWILPFLIFFCLSSVLSGFKKSAPLMVFLTLLFVILSNGLPLLVGYSVGGLILPMICENHIINIHDVTSSVYSLFSFPLPSIIKNEWALFAGFLLGIISSTLPDSLKQKSFSFFNEGKKISLFILQKGFIPFLPLYVFGFIVKMNYDGALTILIHSYSKVFFVTIILIFLYLVSMYMIAAKGNMLQAKQYFQTMLPAGLTGFSTMSSVASLPVTLECVEKNIKDKTFSEFIVPATVNIHMAADGLNIALTALSLLIMTCKPLPEFSIFMLFTLHYCMAKFSAVGAPGGGVIVVLPVIQEFLGLSPELAGLLATIYILQDSLMTSSNVMANGALSIMSHKIFQFFGIYKQDAS